MLASKNRLLQQVRRPEIREVSGPVADQTVLDYRRFDLTECSKIAAIPINGRLSRAARGRLVESLVAQLTQAEHRRPV